MAIRIRRGDTVQVIAGDDKGKVGKVLSVDPVKGRVIVENVNFVKRHTKARRQGMKSGIIEKEAALRLSNVMLYDSRAQRGTRVGIRVLADGRRERVSKQTGETI
ncbi:MAG: 50S ribosomal protein L24 [Candidatus Eisenbacteria bacterium RBG_16_71_46]|nr:ribosomal protein L24 [uncultured bacterium]OGF18320.1 MAG: 50S ribosomal protein L24 [Candidatus Eisenbacteria bacterium RBG_16_71_46]OGF24573.1 MAG: 50S ribosomal protein L24 [Candidatus Eisenbacteria bacterium RBG_19FT_COMBO_70_11]